MNPVFNAAVIGDPIEHSLSPVIFHWLSQKLNAPICYERLRISAQDWDEQRGFYSKINALDGWNVTLPLKKKMISCLRELSDEAQGTGAVNVVHRRVDRSLKGYNTDVFGVSQTLIEQGVTPKNQINLIFGAGGAALAAAYALGQLNASEVWVWNRSTGHAMDLIKRVQPLFPHTQFINVSESLHEYGGERPHLYINATPIGMKGYPEVFHLCPLLNPKGFAFDLVYSAERTTPFIEFARTQGLCFVSGLDMLVWQALATWEIWFNPLDHQSTLKAHLLQYIQDHVLTSRR